MLLVAAVLLALACVSRYAWASETATAVKTARVRVFQEYKVPVSGLQSTFEYVIEPAEEGAPLPVDAEGKSLTSFTLTREEDLWLDFPVEVTADPSATPYVHRYMLRPSETSLPDGLYYVDALSTSLAAGVNEYALELHVQPANSDAEASVVIPTVHVEGWDGPKVTDPGWRVSYIKPEDKSGGSSGRASGSSGGSSGGASGSSGSSSGSSSKTTLSKTGDALSENAAMLGIACAGMLLLIGASLLRWRTGGNRA